MTPKEPKPLTEAQRDKLVTQMLKKIEKAEALIVQAVTLADRCEVGFSVTLGDTELTYNGEDQIWDDGSWSASSC